MNPAELEDIQAAVGKGWHALLAQLVHDLLALGWDGDVHQVKEKFGTLRFYIGAASPEVHAAIDRAEERSGHICEDCGAPGSLRTGGWWRTLCPACCAAAVEGGE